MSSCLWHTHCCLLSHHRPPCQQDLSAVNFSKQPWLFGKSAPALDLEAESSLKGHLMGMILGRFTSLVKATQGRDIRFLPLDVVISKRYPEVWLPSGDHKGHLPEQTNPHWGWRVERWQEAGLDIFIGCLTSRFAIIWENECLSHLSHFDFISKILFTYLLFVFVYGVFSSLFRGPWHV